MTAKKKTQWAAGALVALGLAQMCADLTDAPIARALFMAAEASPAPKVFGVVNGMEPFSSEFTLTWTDDLGSHALDLTPEVNARFRGPYNRRNIYGVVIAGAPAVYGNARVWPMFDAVLTYSLCGDAPLLREVGVTNGHRPLDARITYRTKVNPNSLPMKVDVACPD
jgi:hypothetical protein